MTPIAGMLLSISTFSFVRSRGGHLPHGIEATHGCVNDIEATNAISDIFRRVRLVPKRGAKTRLGGIAREK